MKTIINREAIKKQIAEISNLFDNEKIEEIAKETLFVQRNSKLTATIFLSIFTLGMNMYEKPSLNHDEIKVEEWAKKSYKIPYEVLCGFGNRLPRLYIDNND